MAENYGYGRYRDNYESDHDDCESGYDHADDHADDAADYGAEEDNQSSGARYDDPERLDAAHAATYRAEHDTDVSRDEAVNEALDDPAVNESASYQRIRRMKRSQRLQALARREGKWIPPDLTGYGSPVFWPAEEPHVQGPARRTAIDPFEVRYHVLRQVFMTTLVSCPEMARAKGLDEAEVMEAAQFLQKRGLLRSVAFGCLMPRTARYSLAPEYVDGGSWSDLAPAVVSWHSDDGMGCLLRYDMPRVESINQVAVRYVVDGWELDGVAWLERSALQAVAWYSWKAAPHVKAAVYFVWVSQWDTERDVSERLADLPGAVSRITDPGFPGSVVLIGADRWAVARALPMAVESLRVSGVEPAHVAAWTYAGGWQAASGASMLDGAARPFTPTLATVRLDRFVWPRSRRRLGRMKLETVINGCPWTRSDSSTLYPFFNRVAEHIGCSIAHCAALGGKSEKDRLAWR